MCEAPLFSLRPPLPVGVVDQTHSIAQKEAMKPAHILCIATILYVLLPPGRFTNAGATDWPGWGGPNGNFTVNDAGVIQTGQRYDLRVVWKKRLGTGYSAVSVRGGLAVTAFSDGASDYVIGLDAEDGSERWRHTIGPATTARRADPFLRRC